MKKMTFDPEFLIDETLALSEPKLEQALAYWRTKCGDRLAPTRADIDAREAKAFLPDMQLYEVLDGGRSIRARLVGTAVVRLANDDVTGQDFDDTSPRRIVHRLLRAVRWVVEHRKPLRAFAERSALENKEFLASESLLLPLSNDGTTIDMIAIVGVFKPATS